MHFQTDHLKSKCGLKYHDCPCAVHDALLNNRPDQFQVKPQVIVDKNIPES